MTAYYWTTEHEDPDVYHDKRRCPDGEQILPKNLAESDVRPLGRVHCAECAKVSA